MKTTQPKRSFLSRLGRFLVGLFLALAILFGATSIAGARASANLAAKYPPIGQMVDVGGYRLHIYCIVEGSPNVIMDAGNGESGLDWSLVQPEVAKSTRVCVYDRAGYGWSDPSSKPRMPKVNVEELHTLLQNAGIPAPYVLVAHSYGGNVARLFANTYPDEVAGMVLVDTSPDVLLTRLSPAEAELFLQSAKQGAGQARMGIALQKIGILPLFPTIFPVQAALPLDVANAERALAASDPSHLEAFAAELSAYRESFTQMQEAQITSLGDIPLKVLCRGRHEAAYGEEGEKVWQELQKEMAGLSTNGEYIVAEQSGHFIQLEQPDLIIKSILDVLAAIGK